MTTITHYNASHSQSCQCTPINDQNLPEQLVLCVVEPRAQLQERLRLKLRCLCGVDERGGDPGRPRGGGSRASAVALGVEDSGAVRLSVPSVPPVRQQLLWCREGGVGGGRTWVEGKSEGGWRDQRRRSKHNVHHT